MSYYVRDGDDRVLSTDWTIGPWSPSAQHAGPPSALLGCEIDRAFPREDAQVVRFTAEILGPVPVGPLTITTRMERPGRSVELLSGSLYDDRQREVMRASVWRIRLDDTTGLEQVLPPYSSPAGPEQGVEVPGFPVEGDSYLTSLDLRFVRGAFLEKGPATVWSRMRQPLVQDEEIPLLARALVIADSGNGISSVLDWTRWLFINPDLTVTLRRLPRSEWVCLDAATAIEPHGIGLAESVISDLDGPIGRGLQTLLVGRR